MRETYSKVMMLCLVLVCLAFVFLGPLFDRPQSPISLQIIAGYGIEKCNVHTNKSDLKREAGWSKPIQFSNFPTDIMGFLRNPERGIEVKYYKDRLILVAFVYRDDRFTPFPGSSSGIGEDATVSEVLSIHGKPTQDSNYELPKSGSRYRILYYHHLGIDYEFRNEELQSVSVYPPNIDVDALLKAAYKDFDSREKE